MSKDPESLPTSLIACARILRGLAFAATVTASVVIAFSGETYTLPSTDVEIKMQYRDLNFFKAFLGANIAASVYGLIFTFIPVKSLLWRLALALDVIVCILLASMDSVAVAAAYIHKVGDSQAYQQPICDQVQHYCNLVMAAIAAGFTGVLLYLIIIIYSIYVLLNPLLVQ